MSDEDTNDEDTNDEGRDRARAAWAGAGSWSTRGRMNELETTMWRSERHPQQSSTLACLLLLDRAPSWPRVVAAHEWAASLVARARQRVVEPLLPTGPPAWAVDQQFSLPYHLRRQQLGARNAEADLLELAESLVLAPFDRSRPLWEATLIDGLEGGRAAYLLKLHHSLTDGLGAVQLLSAVLSRTRRHVPDKPGDGSADTEPGPSPWAVTARGALDLAQAAPGLLDAVAGAGWATLTDPIGAVGRGQRFAASLRRMLTPTAATPSPLLRQRNGRRWILRILDCPLADLRQAGRAGGGSVNDAYLAALLGGLRIYHEAHGVEIDEIPITVPVSLRRADDPMGGNRFAGAMIAAPVGLADPADRIAAMRGAILSQLNEPAIDSYSVITPLLNRLPSAVGSMTMRLGACTDLAASNVPGLVDEVYLAGARVDRVFPFGPLPGVAVMAVLASYQGTCGIGLTLDAAAVADPDLLVGCLQAGFEEVLALAAPPASTKE